MGGAVAPTLLQEPPMRCLRRALEPSHPTPFLEENPRAIALTPSP
ncbi:MAG: hypothetical protein V7K26_25480 [Nostoc sp.]